MTPSATQLRSEETTDQTAIRPFRFKATDTELDEMRRRITATRFPEKETVADFSQGVQLGFIQALARYWATDYNWRRCEAQLNSHPQFITEMDRLISTSFTSGRDMKMPCRSSSPTAGQARPSSS